jgi:hypothetical protein
VATRASPAGTDVDENLLRSRVANGVLGRVPGGAAALARYRRARVLRWSRIVDPRPARPLDHIVLHAVIGTYAEEDIIEATVANALTQGCERVLLVDNDSPDRTVDRAESAGAELADVFVTPIHDEGARADRVNAITSEATVASGEPHVWWLFLDADELPHGPRGRTIRQHLEGLDRSIRVVGTRTFNHFPDRAPANVPGRHPADHQPLCQERTGRVCLAGHWKHPLLRIDVEGPAVPMDLGWHRAGSPRGRRIPEAADPIITHHFNFRNEADTRARMDLLRGETGQHASRIATNQEAMGRRHEQLDAVYARDWGAMDTTDHFDPGIEIDPRAWDQIAPDGRPDFARWY